MPTKHGLWKTPEFRVWQGMLSRCDNPNDPKYSRYGGRGIKVCQRWREFIHFYSDMGPRPSSGHSVDRISTDGDYCPENCRWATAVQQANNRSSNHLVCIGGTTHTLAEWARIYDRSLGAVYARVLTHGWTYEEALETPVRQCKKKRKVVNVPNSST